MPDCCLNEGLLKSLRSLECTPVKADQHFLNMRRGEECWPYVVVQSQQTSGLRTSDAVEIIDNVRLVGYFSLDKPEQANQWSDLLRVWLFRPDCIILENCGCFCLRSAVNIQMTASERGYQVTATFRGQYSPSEMSS